MSLIFENLCSNNNFDKNEETEQDIGNCKEDFVPLKILYKDKDEQQKSISLYNYYKIQYHRDIKAKNQPLIIAENNFPKNQKLLGSNAIPKDKKPSFTIEYSYFCNTDFIYFLFL